MTPLAPRLCAVAFLLAALTGCGGPSVAEVSGRVTVGGKPPNLSNLTISFVADDGRPVTAEVSADGTYRVSGVPAGKVRVGLAVAEGSAEWEAEARMAEATGSAPLARSKEKPATALARYADPLQSGLSTTLAPGPGNVFDIDIK